MTRIRDAVLHATKAAVDGLLELADSIKYARSFRCTLDVSATAAAAMNAEGKVPSEETFSMRLCSKLMGANEVMHPNWAA